jgi:hypothetical protein
MRPRRVLARVAAWAMLVNRPKAYRRYFGSAAVVSGGLLIWTAAGEPCPLLLRVAMAFGLLTSYLGLYGAEQYLMIMRAEVDELVEENHRNIEHVGRLNRRLAHIQRHGQAPYN